MRSDIDLSKYTEEDLVQLNRQIVERLRFLRQRRCYDDMANLNVGETVSFTPDSGRAVVGTVVRLNKKSVTVVTADGEHWRVAPALLSKTTDANDDGDGRVLSLVSQAARKGRLSR